MYSRTPCRVGLDGSPVDRPVGPEDREPQHHQENRDSVHADDGADGPVQVGRVGLDECQPGDCADQCADPLPTHRRHQNRSRHSPVPRGGCPEVYSDDLAVAYLAAPLRVEIASSLPVSPPVAGSGLVLAFSDPFRILPGHCAGPPITLGLRKKPVYEAIPMGNRA